MNWLRVRFKSRAEDYRPIYTPPDLPEGPWWCTGYGDDYSILVAYVKSTATIYKQWPEAYDLDGEVVDEIKFSDRFQKPDWWVDDSKS